MKSTFFFCLFISFFQLSALACEIHTFAHIFKLSPSLTDDILIKSDCPRELNIKVVEFLSSIDGKLNSRILSSGVSAKQEIILIPDVINIHSAEKILNKKFGNEIISFSNTTSLYSNSFITSNHKTPQVDFKCNNCKDVGHKNIRLFVDKKPIWLSSTLFKKLTAYKVKQTISTMNPILSIDDFEKITLLSEAKTPLFTDIENIRFYKLTKNLSANDLLQVNHLTPKTIVSKGQRIKISIKNNSVKIDTTGIAMRSGKLGDYIQVKNPNSNKKTLAKIIDFNKVHIEL